MKNAILFLTLFSFIFASCGEVFYHSDPVDTLKIRVINESDSLVNWVTVYNSNIRYDSLRHQLTKEDLKEVIKFQNIKSKDTSEVQVFNIRDFSKIDYGVLSAFANKDISQDTLKFYRFSYYNNFNFAADWDYEINGYDIIVRNKSKTDSIKNIYELQPRFALIK